MNQIETLQEFIQIMGSTSPSLLVKGEKIDLEARGQKTPGWISLSSSVEGAEVVTSLMFSNTTVAVKDHFVPQASLSLRVKSASRESDDEDEPGTLKSDQVASFQIFWREILGGKIMSPVVMNLFLHENTTSTGELSVESGDEAYQLAHVAAGWEILTGSLQHSYPIERANEVKAATFDIAQRLIIQSGFFKDALSSIETTTQK